MRSLPIFVVVASTAYALQCPLLQGDAAADHIAQHVSCPEGNHIRQCVRVTSSAASDLDTLVQCLRVTGCDDTDNLIRWCYAQELLNGGLENADLRRRQESASTGDAAATVTAAATGDTAATSDSSKATGDSTTHKDQTETKTGHKTTATEATTTADTQTTAAATTAAATSATSTPSTLETQTSASSSPMTTAPMSEATDPNGGRTCLTTHFVSTSFCGIISVDGSPTTLPCVPTTTPSVSCAPGMFCQSAAAGGGVSCMKRQDNLTKSGLIVTIVFGSAFAFCIGALIFFLCRSKRSRAKQERMLQAQAASKMQDQGRRDAEAVGIVGPRGYNNGGGRGGRGGDEMGVPLMAQQGPGGGLETGYRGGGRTLTTDGPVSSRGVSPFEEGRDIGYGRRG